VTNAVYDPTSPNPVIVFVEGVNGELFDLYWNGSGWVWQDQGVPPGTSGVVNFPSALYDPKSPNPLMVFVEGNNAHLVDKYWNGSKWVWQDQGIPPGDVGVDGLCGLSAVYDPTLSNPIAVFMVGTSTGALYQKYYDGTTSAWVWQNQGTP
jgi:hypothetical protein